MCTENEEFQASQEIKKNQCCEDIKICHKCRINIPSVFLRSDGVYCRECFVSRITHKFRLEFGKSHLIRDNEKVLVFIECSKFSLVLLHLINEGISKRAKKKLRFIPLCVFIIDENTTGPIEDVKEKFINPINNFELPICIYQASQLYEVDIHPVYTNIDLSEPNMMSNQEYHPPHSIVFKNQTSKITLNNILKRQLLVRIAKKLGILKVITSENADQLASSLIVNVIEGRGDQLSYQMSFVDSRNDDIIFVRPLKNFTTAEVDACISLNSLSAPQPPTNQANIENSGVYTSMQHLTETFLKKLQTNNENTLPIICRIGEKFSPVENVANKCLLCKSPFTLENSVGLVAPNLIPSTCGPAHAVTNINCDTNKEICVNCDDATNTITSLTESNGACCGRSELLKRNCCRDKKNSELFRCKEDLLKYSCYGCKILINDMKNYNELPSYIFSDVMRIKNRESMHKTVKEYLLIDN